MTFTRALSTNNYGPAKFVVDGTTPANGTHSTITAAIASATAGDTIFIRPGTYTENLTLKSGVNLASYDFQGGSGFRTKIIGKLIDGGEVVGVTLTNLAVQTNSDNIIALTGSGTAVVFEGCYIACTNNTGISVAAGTTVFIYNCVGDLGTTGIGFWTGAGSIQMYKSNFTNSGSSLTVSTTSGSVLIDHCEFSATLSTSSGGQYTVYDSIIGLTALNTTAVTTAGTGTSSFTGCQLYGGTASAISIGSGTTVNINQCTVSSSNTNAITGAGTISFSDIVFTGSSNTINTTTQNGNYVNLGKYRATAQTAFLAHVATTIPNVTGDGTVYTIIFDTEDYDVGGDFNLGSSTFTAPVTGKYFLQLACLVTGGTVINSANLRIVTTLRTYNETMWLSPGNTTAVTGNMSVIADMTAGNTATFTVSTNDTGGKVDDVNGTSSGDLRTYVSGYLVC